MQLLIRPCPGRVAYRVCCAAVCAEQACDNGNIRDSAALFAEPASSTCFGKCQGQRGVIQLVGHFEGADCARGVQIACPLRRR